MRIVVWGINYAPEVTGIAPYNGAFCEFLAQRGHSVEMVTTFPYYPVWEKRPEDRRRLYRTDLLKGVPVHRCWHYVPRRLSALRRIVHEATFVATSLFRVLVLAHVDVMVVVSPPLLLGVAACIAKVLRDAPFVFHVQDLQPDAALGLGMLKSRRLAQVLHALEALAYRKAARVSGISQAMMKAFAAKGVPPGKRVYLPNGVALPDLGVLPDRGRFRQRLGFTETELLAVYSGNLGVKQGLLVLVEAAALCRDRRVLILICGDGAERAALASEIAKRVLPNIQLLPLQDRARYEEMLVDADLCLITQRAGSGNFFLPSKLLTSLAFAKPILAVADKGSELEEAVLAGRFGYCTEPGNPVSIARVLDGLAGERERLSTMGGRGREYVQRFAMEKVLTDFEAVLREVVPRTSKT